MTTYYKKYVIDLEKKCLTCMKYSQPCHCHSIGHGEVINVVVVKESKIPLGVDLLYLLTIFSHFWSALYLSHTPPRPKSLPSSVVAPTSCSH